MSPRIYTRQPPEQRFAKLVDKRGPDECWLWLGSRVGAGYGRFRLGGAKEGYPEAHRYAWEQANGRPVPSGMFVCHSCDNPSCVNPAHLWIGSATDNNLDRDTKGRTSKGDRWYQTHPHRTRYDGKPVTVANGRPRRAKKDPVTAVVRWSVMQRDKACVLWHRDPSHVCRDKWGRTHAPSNTRLLTVEHVKEALRMGVRAPSDLGHLVAMCHAGNVGVPTKEEREWIRDWIADKEGLR